MLGCTARATVCLMRQSEHGRLPSPMPRSPSLCPSKSYRHIKPHGYLFIAQIILNRAVLPFYDQTGPLDVILKKYSRHRKADPMNMGRYICTSRQTPHVIDSSMVTQMYGCTRTAQPPPNRAYRSTQPSKSVLSVTSYAN
jgi:hypothetical protein